MIRLTRRARLHIILVVAMAATSACSANPEQVRQQFMDSGDAYVAAGKLPEAIIQYRNAVQQDPQFGAARAKLSEAYLGMGDRVNAAREMVRAADLLPSDPVVQVKAGNMLLVARMFEEAQVRAEKALALVPGLVDAQILRANALAGLSRLEEAVAEMETALANDPTRGSSYASLGAIQLIRGKRDEAERAFKQAVSAAPRSPQSHLALANYYLAVGRRDDAEAELKQALAIRPDHLLANRAIAYFYVATGRAAEAEAHLRRVAEGAPDASGRLALAAYYAAANRAADARRELEQVVVANREGVVAARLQLASLNFSARDFAGTARQLAEVLSREPTNTLALTAQAELEAEQGHLDRALASARTAITSDPRAVAARFAEGRIHLLRRDEVSAQASFNEALRLDPRFVRAKGELARIHLNAGRLDQAEQFAHSVATELPNSADAAALLARIHLARGNVARAETALRNVASSAPAVHVARGFLALRTNNVEAARGAFSRALDANPGHVEALEQLVRLDLTAGLTAEAQARVDAARAKRPADPAVLLLASTTALATNRPADAERYARSALEVDPNNLDAYVSLGRTYASVGRLADATRQFESLAERQPASTALLTALGVLLQMQNKVPEAQANYERALQIDARAAVAANNLAWLLTEHGGNLDRALSLAQVAKAELPSRAEVNDTLGWIYCRKGLHSMAIPLIERALASAPDNPSYHYHLGAALVGFGSTSRARLSLERALALGGASFAEAPAVNRLLAELGK